MHKRSYFTIIAVLFAAAITLCCAARAQAQGDYYRVHPITGQPMAGHLGEITKDKVVLQTSINSKEFPVNEIKYVQFPGEPRDLMEARNALLEDHAEQSLDWLNKIPPPQLANDAVRQDVDYYKALATARQAIEGTGDVRRGCRPAGFFESQSRHVSFL